MYINLNSTIYINTAYQINYLSENGDFFFRDLQFIKIFKTCMNYNARVLKKYIIEFHTSYEWYIILTQFISKDIKNMYLP